MDAVTTSNERREELIGDAMRRYGLERADAEFMIAVNLGEIDGDILTTGLSPDERQALGIGSHTIVDNADEEAKSRRSA